MPAVFHKIWSEKVIPNTEQDNKNENLIKGATRNCWFEHWIFLKSFLESMELFSENWWRWRRHMWRWFGRDTEMERLT